MDESVGGTLLSAFIFCPTMDVMCVLYLHPGLCDSSIDTGRGLFGRALLNRTDVATLQRTQKAGPGGLRLHARTPCTCELE
jgi:hypothetical protein